MYHYHNGSGHILYGKAMARSDNGLHKPGYRKFIMPKMPKRSSVFSKEHCCKQGGTSIGKKDPGSIFFLRPPSAGLTNYVIRHMS